MHFQKVFALSARSQEMSDTESVNIHGVELLDGAQDKGDEPDSDNATVKCIKAKLLSSSTTNCDNGTNSETVSTEETALSQDVEDSMDVDQGFKEDMETENGQINNGNEQAEVHKTNGHSQQLTIGDDSVSQESNDEPMQMDVDEDQSQSEQNGKTDSVEPGPSSPSSVANGQSSPESLQEESNSFSNNKLEDSSQSPNEIGNLFLPSSFLLF